jgi:class 3 adenylate cyclase
MDGTAERGQTAAVDDPEARDSDGTVAGPERDRTTALLLVVSLAAAVLAASAPLWWRFGGLDLGFVLVYASGLGLLAAGFIISRWRSGRAIARLILLSAILYFIQFAHFAPSDLPFTVGSLMQGYWMPVAGHFVIAFPDGGLRSGLERGVVIAAYAWSTFMRVHVFFVDQREFGCADCPENLLLIRSDRDVALLLGAADSVVPVIVTSLVLFVLARRWWRATRPERFVLSPMFVALGINVVAAIGLYATLGEAALVTLTLDHQMVVLGVQQAAVTLLPIGLVVGNVRSVLARSAVANLLVRIGQGGTVAELERDIGWVLGDPAVRIIHRLEADADAARADDAGDERMTVIGSLGTSEVAMLHDPSLRRYQPQLLAAVTAATRVALENQRLQAEATLTASVPAGLAERLQREGRRIGDVSTMTISVLMADVRGYSTIAENADLHTLARQLHEHRVAMNRAVTGRGGVVMQFVGDEVFAVFGAPQSVENHALLAVRAAIDMQQAQRAINDAWGPAGLVPFRLGIGLTTGTVAAALLGSSEHVEYSVVGDVVNLAQRLQAWAAGGEIVISEETFTALRGAIPAEPMPQMTVKGRRGVVAAYRLAVPQPPLPVVV